MSPPSSRLNFGARAASRGFVLNPASSSRRSHSPISFNTPVTFSFSWIAGYDFRFVPASLNNDVAGRGRPFCK